MSWKLIRSIQGSDEIAQRLIMPFGLSLNLGDVVEVQRDGTFLLEGSSKTLLNLDAGTPRSGKPKDIYVTYGGSTECKFRAAGDASTLLDELPKANAGFDVSFGSSNSWVVACSNREIKSLTELNRFRKPILDSYRMGVWKPDWALVIEIGVVDNMTLLASTSRNTKIAISLGATVADGAAMSAKLTASPSIAWSNQQFSKFISHEPATTFCRALRVKEHWFHDPTVEPLEAAKEPGNVEGATENEFWEDVDDLGLS